MITPLTLVGNQCEVHKYHWPVPLRTVKHHIHPQEFGGPTTPANLVKVCDNGHYSIHTVLDALLRGKTPPKSTRRERQLAELGFTMIQTARGAR